MTFERNTKGSMSDQMYSQLSIRLGLLHKTKCFWIQLQYNNLSFFFARLAFICEKCKFENAPNFKCHADDEDFSYFLLKSQQHVKLDESCTLFWDKLLLHSLHLIQLLEFKEITSQRKTRRLEALESGKKSLKVEKLAELREQAALCRRRRNCKYAYEK